MGIRQQCLSLRKITHIDNRSGCGASFGARTKGRFFAHSPLELKGGPLWGVLQPVPTSSNSKYKLTRRGP
jgi:hypothetical protein